MHLSYRQSGSLAAVREFFAEVVAIVRGEPVGAWTLVNRTPLPHEWHGALEVLARTEWRLGAATLVQTVAGGDGNPRDGHGFDVALALAVPGLDGGPRQVSIEGSSYDPVLQSLTFKLAGFGAAEFVQMRAAGRARFGSDDTANVVWAAHNVEALIGLGERDLARELAVEALAGPAPAWARSVQQSLRRALLELCEDKDARALAESELLLADTCETQRLAQVASGARRLPAWTAEAAAQVLAIMQPWEGASAARLGEVARRWFDHPWWRPMLKGSLGAWSSLRTQAFDSRREGGEWVRTPRGEPQALKPAYAIHFVRKALALDDVDVSIRREPVDGTHQGEGFVLCLAGAATCVRAVVHHRQQGPDFEHRWTWLWTGVGLEGAVVVTRLAAPTVPSGEWLPVENHVSWLGSEEAAERFMQALRSQDAQLRISPA